MSYAFRITAYRQLEVREHGHWDNWKPLTPELIRFMAGSHLQGLMQDLTEALPKGEVAAQIHPTLIEVREWVEGLSPTARAAISVHDMKTLDSLLDDERVRQRTWK